jgi:hypothetical protein
LISVEHERKRENRQAPSDCAARAASRVGAATQPCQRARSATTKIGSKANQPLCELSAPNSVLSVLNLFPLFVQPRRRNDKRSPDCRQRRRLLC